MVLPLDVVHPAADAEQSLLRREVVLRFAGVDEADGLQELGPVGFGGEVAGEGG